LQFLGERAPRRRLVRPASARRRHFSGFCRLRFPPRRDSPMTRSRRIFAALALGLCVGAPAFASPDPTQVVFTVDAETNEAFSLPDQMDAVCAGALPCGAMEIVRLLRQRGWAATIFLNVFEQQRWGGTVMRDIA